MKNLCICPFIKKICEVSSLLPQPATHSRGSKAAINSKRKSGSMLSSLNNIAEVIQKYQTQISPNLTKYTLSSLRPPIFTEFIPFRGEEFRQGHLPATIEALQLGNAQTKDLSSVEIINLAGINTPPKSAVSIFFETLANVIFIGLYVLIVGFIAMIVANDMIVLPAPYRFMGFFLTLILCLFPPFMFVFILYYGIRAAYAASINFVLGGGDGGGSNADPLPYLPRIFAILPIITTKYESSIAQFLMYPFTFPKSEKADTKLIQITQKYIKSLVNSFTGLDKYKRSFSNSEDVYNKALLSIINTNTNSPIKSVQEFMDLSVSVSPASSQPASSQPASSSTTI